MIRNTILVVAIITGIVVSCKESEKKAAENKIAVQAAANDDPSTYTTIMWIDSALNKGTIDEGEKLEIVYRFKNTGEKPLVIKDVRPSCGCTVAEKPLEPIAPGKEGLIKAEFNSHGKQGQTHKTITVTANTQQQTYSLVFDVNINKKS